MHGHEQSPLCGYVDMVSFTGSTYAGIKVAETAAPTVKRVCQELGGKSPYIITEDADLEAAVRYGVEDVMLNTGQTCNALTRMFLPRRRYEEAVNIAKKIAEENIVGNPFDSSVTMGPMASTSQKQTVLNYIKTGIAEGARLVTGGINMPPGLHVGAYVQPTMKIARRIRAGQCYIAFIIYLAIPDMGVRVSGLKRVISPTVR